MKRKNWLVLGTALVVASVGAFAFLGSESTLKFNSSNYVSLGLKRSIELRTNAPDECFRLTYPDGAGVVRGALPVQCNGDRGVVEYDPATKKIARQMFYFKESDRVRYRAEYSKDGTQILNGFALRDDGSTLWQAMQSGTSAVTTIQYWWNGKIFSIEQRRVGSPKVDVRFFRADGKDWMHYKGVGTVKLKDARSEDVGIEEGKVWNENGAVVFDVRVGTDRKPQYSFYRPDGTLSYTQMWELHTWGGPEGSSTSYALIKLRIYDTDGKMLIREVMKSPAWFAVTGTVEYHRDGSRIELEATPKGDVKHVTAIDPDGNKTMDKDVPEGTQKIQEYDSHLDNRPEVKDDPQQAWADAEVAHFQHTLIK
jgi:hypothetical protein